MSIDASPCSRRSRRLVFRGAIVVATLAATRASAQGSGELEAGIGLFEARRYAAARARLTPLATDSGSATAAQYLGRIALLDRDLDAAQRYLSLAVRLEPRVARHHLWLGRAYGQQALRAGKLRAFSLAKKSRAELETAVGLDPSDVESRSELAHFYAIAPGIVGGSKTRAHEEADAIAERDPYRGRLVRGFVREREKRFDRAAAEYRAAMREHPDSAAPHYLLGLMYQNRGMLDSARRVFARALERFPTERAPYYYVARVNVLAGAELDQAEQLLERYLASSLDERDPPYASAHFRLGQICERTGRRDEARRHFETALRLDPTRGEYRRALASLR
jgi:tetratricopeptide (TPR) repeat protein